MTIGCQWSLLGNIRLDGIAVPFKASREVEGFGVFTHLSAIEIVQVIDTVFLRQIVCLPEKATTAEDLDRSHSEAELSSWPDLWRCSFFFLVFFARTRLRTLYEL